VDNTRDYARVSHNRQWSNYNIILPAVRYGSVFYLHQVEGFSQLSAYYA